MNHWVRKFAIAFRGIAYGMAGQSSFIVHIIATIAVLLLAAWLRCSQAQWCVLALCIALVWTAELFNSSIEILARTLCPEHNTEVGKALDVASGAVMAACISAAIIGIAVFVSQIWAN